MKTNLRLIILVICVLCVNLLSAIGSIANGADYYIDYETGSDLNSGVSTSTPWKHCPGDSNATGNPSGITLQAGDTVYFKGGVYYKGQIDVNASGSSENRIVYDGQPSWGTGEAIIDGSTTLNWTQCPDQATCDNANYANMFYATLPDGADWRIPVFEDDAWMEMSSTVSSNPTPFFYKDTEYFHAISSGITATTLTDVSRFTQADSTYWTGAKVLVHITGNQIGVGTVTSFNPSTDTITYDSVGTPYQDTNWDSKYHYSVISHIHLINAEGQYAVDEINSKIYVRPSNINNVSVGSLTYGFHTDRNSYITIDGFVIQGQYGTAYVPGRAITGSTSLATNGNIIQNCDIKNNESCGATASTYMKGDGIEPNIVQNNTFSYIRGRGAFGTDNKVHIKDNTFNFLTKTVIYYQNSPTSGAINGEISGNIIDNCRGVHQNGITIYGSESYPSHGFIVKKNKVLNFSQRHGPFAHSCQGHYDILYYNNIFEGQIADDGPGAGYIRYYNNTIIDAAGTSKGLRVASIANCNELTIENNIIDGFLLTNGTDWDDAKLTCEYNIYTSLAWTQAEFYGWSLGTGESVEADLSNIFVDAGNDNFHLSSSSVAIDVGKDLSAVFTTAIDDLWRPRNEVWDIGAYEYFKGPTNLRIIVP